ncbi:MAG: ABC transporter ATP-binding protein [Gemmatimonadaceae bacterium]|nr:ABC transporter ATP-binding protein [Gemmatimonadaceae bacterium]
MSEPPALSLEHIARRFGSVEALVDASLSVRAGTVHALLGENGAGKTTLMRIAFGMLRPDAGVIRIAGEPVSLTSPAAALARGVGMVHQHFTFVPAMTVAENVALGGHGRYGRSEARAHVEDVARRVGLAVDPDARAGDLPVGAQQRLEIVKALARGARTLILDEPTAVLAPPEGHERRAALRGFAERGGSVVIITHKLREALAAADDVTVLRRGRTIFTGSTATVGADELARAMIGDAVYEPPRRTPSVPRDVVIEAVHLAAADARGALRVRDASVTARGGEILGVAGVEGAGQHELLRMLAGRLKPSRGKLRIPERIGFVPEDRHRDALVLDFTLYENLALRGAGRARGRIRWPAVVERTHQVMAQFDVRGASPNEQAAALSGGNQQKLVLARELGDLPTAVIVENPTRGLDIAATAAIHRQLVAARDAGAAVVLYSSDLDEVLSLADRMIVMYQGSTREVALNRDAIGRAMLGAS